MRRLYLILIMFLQLPLVAALAQDQSTLTVTATVVTSVAVVMDQTGNARVVVANPADRNDNVSYVSQASKVPESRKKSDPVKVRPAVKRKVTPFAVTPK